MKFKPEYFLYYFIFGIVLNVAAPSVTGTFEEPTKIGLILDLTIIPSLIVFFLTRNKKVKKK